MGCAAVMFMHETDAIPGAAPAACMMMERVVARLSSATANIAAANAERLIPSRQPMIRH